MGVKEARKRLDHAIDRDLLGSLVDLWEDDKLDTWTLVLVRHARAVKRSVWKTVFSPIKGVYSMIAKEFENFLLQQEDTFLTPAENLAVLIDIHNADHAILLLSQMTYSRVPVGNGFRSLSVRRNKYEY